MRWSVWLSVLVTLGSTFFLAAVHLQDRYRIDHVSGVWAVLADAVNRDGIRAGLYPPLRSPDGEHLGGTRYMPLGILATSVTARFTGNVVSAGKLVSLIGSAALVLAIAWIGRWPWPAPRSSQTSTDARARICPWPISLGFAGLVLITEPGQIGALTARQEAWPAALQLLAVGLVLRHRKPLTLVLAATLSVAAFLFKLSAVWAPIAIGLWLLFTNRRAWLIYCVSYWLLAASLLYGLNTLTSGRMLETLTGLGGAGLDAPGGFASQVADAIRRLALSMATHALVEGFVAIFALLAIIRSIRSHRVDAIVLALPVASLLLLVLFLDVGVASNHLIDVLAISAVLASQFLARDENKNPSAVPRDRSVAMAALNVLVIVGGLGYGAYTLARPVVQAAKQVASGNPNEWASPTPLAGIATPQSKVFCEDPSLWLTIDQRPEFTDPFMLPRLFVKHPDWAEPIARRIEAETYESIVLILRIDLDPEHYRSIHLGQRITQAITAHYRFDRIQGNQRIYKPIPKGEPNSNQASSTESR